MTRYAVLSRPEARWVDGGRCARCRHTLWRVVGDGGLVAKITLSRLCGRRGRGHEVKS